MRFKIYAKGRQIKAKCIGELLLLISMVEGEKLYFWREKNNMVFIAINSIDP
jgi:hypothetical protein